MILEASIRTWIHMDTIEVCEDTTLGWNVVAAELGFGFRGAVREAVAGDVGEPLYFLQEGLNQAQLAAVFGGHWTRGSYNLQPLRKTSMC